MKILKLAQSDSKEGLFKDEGLIDTFFLPEGLLSFESRLKIIEELRHIYIYITGHYSIIYAEGDEASLIAFLLSSIAQCPVYLKVSRDFKNGLGSLAEIYEARLADGLIFEVEGDFEDKPLGFYENLVKDFIENTKKYRDEKGNLDFSKLYHFEEIRGLLSSGEKVIIYGASEYCGMMIEILNNSGVEVYAICDDWKNKQGNTVNSVPIVSYDELKRLKEKTPSLDKAIILTAPKEVIEEKLKAAGFESIYVGNYGLGGYEKDFYPKTNDYLLGKVPDVLKLYSLLEDEKSKKVFEAVIYSRFLCAPKLLAKLRDDNQYFDEVISLSEDEVFVDCGAYLGDTIEAFLKNGNGKYKKIYSFEPDKEVFDELERKFGGFEDIKLFCGGVYSSDGEVGFDCLDLQRSRVDEEAVFKIKTYKLDKIFDGEERPTMIKMDIEGAEQEALKGAEKIISETAPKLAISVYHLPEDLIAIPLYIKSLRPEYRFYMRHYSRNKTDTLIYAVCGGKNEDFQN